ncbi:MAG: PKD domain-containing protein [Chitinophagaceae bacterium]
MKTQQHIFFLFLLLITSGLAAQSNFDFVENKGQWNSQVKFMGDVGTGSFFLQKNGFTVLLNSQEDLKKLHDISHGGTVTAGHANSPAGGAPGANQPTSDNLRTATTAVSSPLPNAPVLVHAHAYKVNFEGASGNVEIIPEKVQDSYNNYLLGDDPSKWAADCKIYKGVTYRNMYPGIDVRYYSDNGSLKYDIVVNPGASPASIVMKYEGADKLLIKNNQLYVKTSVGDVKELEPYSYQFDKVNGKTDVNCKYEIINGNTVRFKIKSYSREVPLIIDPTIIFSSFSGSKTDNWGFTATPGPDGSLFGGGIVQQNGYPVTPGAVQPIAGGATWDIGLTRFSADGTTRIYSTFLGGSGDDYPLSMIADAQSNLVLMGRTYSTNFPGKKILPAGVANTGADLLVVKLNAAGTAFLGALRIGGSGLDAANVEDQRGAGTSPRKIRTIRFYGDDSRGEVILDGAANIYVATQTQSTDFPLTNPFQATNAGAQDGVILKIDPTCNNVIWSSYVGGKGDDGVFVMDISPTTGNLYVAGATSSTNFPGIKPGVKQTVFQGGLTDGFVSEISSNGTGIIASTYLGTNSYDAIYGIKFDKLGYPYVMGISEGNWPVFNAAYSNPNSKQFISKLKKDLSDFVYSTVFGSGNASSPDPNISPVAFLVDRCENVYVSGWGGSPFVEGDGGFGQLGTLGMPVTPGALKTFTDNKDFYFIVIRKDAVSLLYGTFFGQGGTGVSGFGEHVDGGTSRYDQQGVIYQAICANCEGNSFGAPSPPYPTTPGVVSPVNGAGNQGCNLGVVKIAFNFSGVAAGVKAFINGAFDTSGCVPLTVEFKDTVRNASSYEWHFGDGSPAVFTKDFDIQHVYNAVGDYKVMLVGIDSSSCNIRDTVYTTIRVRNNEAFLAFKANKLQPCESLSYQFTNNTTASGSAPPFTAQSFIWDFGDGTRVVSGPGAITHNFAAAGSYNVRLILPDTNYCNAPDSLPLLLRVAPLVKAQFETPPLGCVPYNAVFANTSLAGYDFTWDFGDGTGSKDAGATVTHLYTTPGNYTVKLIAIDTNTCNKIDSVSMSITTADKPSAAFTWTPLTPQENVPYTFTNSSSPDAIRFKWLFGDGDSLLTASRSNFDHQYNTNGTFDVLLIAYNAAGCPDTARASVVVIIVPRLDLPNAFTPLTNGLNSKIYVRGFGIGRMKWRIYNRFGNLVFESSSQSDGWDGKYKGVLQPMDVYAYTLEVGFTDGTRATKKGDITLLR